MSGKPGFNILAMRERKKKTPVSSSNYDLHVEDRLAPCTMRTLNLMTAIWSVWEGSV
jgi:hypothetical protein